VSYVVSPPLSESSSDLNVRGAPFRLSRRFDLGRLGEVREEDAMGVVEVEAAMTTISFFVATFTAGDPGAGEGEGKVEAVRVYKMSQAI
jgi:hypothetical protein